MNQLRTTLTKLAISTCMLISMSSIALTSQELIESIQVDHNRLTVIINKKLKARYFTSDFFIEYGEDIDLTKLDTSLVIIPFLTNVMTVVWISGKDYYVDFMDEDLYYSVLKIKKDLQRLYPQTKWDGNLIPRKLVKNLPPTALKNPAKEIALLFSGGLDSTSSSYGHYDKKQLLITMWGQWDVPLDKPELWRNRKSYFEKYAQTRGHSNAFIKSNYVDFLNWDVLNNLSPEISTWRVDTTEGMGMMGLAAPLLLLKGYPRLVIGSSYHWEYPYPSSSNPFIDHKLIFANEFHILHDQFDLSRHDKLALIADTIKTKQCPYPYLKVCNGKTAVNCCNTCSKCLATIMALLALKEDPRNYGFNISKKEAVRRAKLYVTRTQCFDTMWPLQITKQKLKTLESSGITVPSSVQWLLDQDLKKNIDWSDMRHLTKLDWKKFDDMRFAEPFSSPKQAGLAVVLSEQEIAEQKEREQLAREEAQLQKERREQAQREKALAERQAREEARLEKERREQAQRERELEKQQLLEAASQVDTQLTTPEETISTDPEPEDVLEPEVVLESPNWWHRAQNYLAKLFSW